MNFKRNRFQLAVEYLVSCGPDELKDKTNVKKFETLNLSQENCELLGTELIEDSRDFYFKGAVSLFEAILGISEQRHSWSVVKAYYSVFYFCRCILAADDTGLFRARSLYSLKLEESAQPKRQTEKGDHKAVLKMFISKYPNNKLFSNKISWDDNEYTGLDYLMHMREVVHYKSRCFNEPDSSYFNEKLVRENEIERYINSYINDEEFIYCFLHDHSLFAFPLKMMLEASLKISTKIEEGILAPEKRGVLHKLRAQANISKGSEIMKLIDA